MKKIISIFILGMLLSCTSDGEQSNKSAEAEAIRLMKVPDKSTLSLSEVKKIVKYLDEKPEDSKYLKGEDISKKEPIVNSKNSAKTADYTMSDYMQIAPFPTNSADFGASVELSDWQTSVTRVKFQWTMLYNINGLFSVYSLENFEVYNLGPSTQYLTLYSIKSVYHGFSYMSGNSGPLSWTETNHNVVAGSEGAYFFVNGRISIPNGSSFQYGTNKYVNVSMMINTNGAYTNY
ncbi:hypothetical protein [Flavobacterium chungangense]|uniref:Uncharacterized protein n=1 Tax=Flavobacterium chungangense TaxID=554283 RepID=A0A6V6YSM7_9FLAO|nr:hypothetical protein [Flavobacterium chungangense]CAD0002460.1 hypothetical protein FLACHUCJ7_00973 [Flavobacterium chungangense]